MSERKFPERLIVGRTDTYTCTLDKAWLGNSTITNYTITVDESKLTKNMSGVDGHVIGVSLTGLATGGHEVRFEWETSDGRTDGKSGILVCVDTYF